MKVVIWCVNIASCKNHSSKSEIIWNSTVLPRSTPACPIKLKLLRAARLKISTTLLCLHSTPNWSCVQLDVTDQVCCVMRHYKLPRRQMTFCKSKTAWVPASRAHVHICKTNRRNASRSDSAIEYISTTSLKDTMMSPKHVGEFVSFQDTFTSRQQSARN